MLAVLFLATDCVRQHAENKVRTSTLVITVQFAWMLLRSEAWGFYQREREQ